MPAVKITTSQFLEISFKNLLTYGLVANFLVVISYYTSVSSRSRTRINLIFFTSFAGEFNDFDGESLGDELFEI